MVETCEHKWNAGRQKLRVLCLWYLAEHRTAKNSLLVYSYKTVGPNLIGVCTERRIRSRTT